MSSDLSVSGLVSGMDTDSIITAVLNTYQSKLDKKNEEMIYESRKKEVINEEIANMQSLKDKILKLKLESTFQNKALSSSDEAVIRGSASTTAIPGNYSITVQSTAVPATVTSSYTRATILNSPPNTMNLSGMTGRPESAFDGLISLTTTESGSIAQTRAIYTKNGGGQFAKYESGIIEGATNGTAASSINGTLSVKIDGENTITLSLSYAQGTTIKTIAYDIQSKINEKMNEIKGTSHTDYVAVKSPDKEGAGNEGLIFYNINSNTEDSIEFTGGTALSALGLDTTTFDTAIEMEDNWIEYSGDLSLLREKLGADKTGIIPGINILASTGMTTGTATLRTNAQLRTLDKIYPQIKGAESISASGSIDLNQKLSEVSFDSGLQISTASDGTATFTINDTSIEISDFSEATVMDFLAIVNSSSAGVTASYDKNTDSFVLTANENYVETSISLGSAADTTNILTVLGISLASGGTLYQGSASANIDINTIINDAAFSGTASSGTFTVNGVTLYVDVTKDTLQTLIDKINNSNAAVTAEYDKNADRFVIKSDPNTTKTNNKKIELGSNYDTSNILEVLNLTYQSGIVTGKASDAAISSETISFVTQNSAGIESTETVTIPSTNYSGAYSDIWTGVWNDGIADGATFTITTDSAANTYTWTNNTGSAIINMEDFAAAWNDSDNWSTYSVIVPAILEGDNQLRFFNNNSTGNFSIDSTDPADIIELGGTSATVTQGIDASPSAQYNALRFAWTINSKSSLDDIVKVRTDGAGGIYMDSVNTGSPGIFFMASANIVEDYFGDVAVRSSTTTTEGSIGRDAQIIVDGTFYTRTSNTIDDVIGGVELNLMSAKESSITVNISNDTDKAIEAIATFIVEYNKLITELSPDYLSTEDKKYLEPLTTEKMDEFTTVSELNSYEEKYKEVTKTKIIREETSFRSFYNYMRSTSSGVIKNAETKFDMLSDLGISAGSLGGYEDGKNGYLVRSYDEDNETEEEYLEAIIEELKNTSELTDALEEDAAKVYKLFSNDSDDVEEMGIARKIEEKINDYILTGGILKDKVKTNGTIDQRLTELSEQYTAYEDRMEKRKETLENQFAAMEEMLQRLQEQQTTISQKLGISTSSS